MKLHLVPAGQMPLGEVALVEISPGKIILGILAERNPHLPDDVIFAKLQLVGFRCSGGNYLSAVSGCLELVITHLSQHGLLTVYSC